MSDGFCGPDVTCRACGHRFRATTRQMLAGETIPCPNLGCERNKAQPPVAVAADVHTFASGAQSSGKLPDYHLVPLLTLLDRLAPRFSLGISKGYGVDGWRKGLSDPAWLLDRANHGLSHFARVVAKVKDGRPTAEGDDDLAGAIWSLVVIAEAEHVREATIATAADLIVVQSRPTRTMAGESAIIISPTATCASCGLLYGAHIDRVRGNGQPGHIRVTDANVRELHFFELASAGPHRSLGDECAVCSKPYRDHTFDGGSRSFMSDGEGRLHHWFHSKTPAPTATTAKVRDDLGQYRG